MPGRSRGEPLENSPGGRWAEGTSGVAKGPGRPGRPTPRSKVGASPASIFELCRLCRHWALVFPSGVSELFVASQAPTTAHGHSGHSVSYSGGPRSFRRLVADEEAHEAGRRNEAPPRALREVLQLFSSFAELRSALAPQLCRFAPRCA